MVRREGISLAILSEANVITRRADVNPDLRRTEFLYYSGMRNEELPLGVYEHFKGGRYEVIGVASHSETLEKMVVYKHLDGDKVGLWVRPLAMFTELVEKNGKKVPRFRYIGK